MTDGVSRSRQLSPHYAGLDTLRFFCALWVAISHISQPAWPEAIHGAVPLSHYLEGIWNNIFCGPAAVIVFFVISGFCIHLPYCSEFKIQSFRVFYVRRFIRIVLPIFIAMWISTFILGYRLEFFEESILWSIWCELIYYAIFPFLLYVRRSLGSWMPIILSSYVLSVAVILSDPGVGNYASFDRELNWVVGLPCWTLGCWGAEKFHDARASSPSFLSAPSARLIWTLRVGAIALATLSSILRFHSPIGYPWTLNAFAIFAVYWIVAEVAYYVDRKPAGILEWFGRSSYSLYLTHMLSLKAIEAAGIQTLQWGAWFMTLAVMLAGSILFWAVVERPSHELARGMARKIGRLPTFLPVQWRSYGGETSGKEPPT